MSTEHSPQTKDQDPLAVLGCEVEALDTAIAVLVSRRTVLGLAIAEEKKVRGIPLLGADPSTKVVETYTGALPEDSLLTPDDAAYLGNVVMVIGRNAQDRRSDLDAQALAADRVEPAGMAVQAAVLGPQ